MKRLVMFLFLLPMAFALGTIVMFSSQASAARIESVATTVFTAALFPGFILLVVDWASAGFGRWLRVSLCAITGLVLGGFAGVFLGELVLTVAPALAILGALFSFIVSTEWSCPKASAEA
jgi:hypothetical protein